MSDEWCYEDSDDCPTGGWLTGHPLLVTCELCIERFDLRKDRDMAAERVTKFTVERSRWFRGKGSTASALMVDGDRMCCLGFLAMRCGLKAHEITGEGDLGTLGEDLPGRMRELSQQLPSLISISRSDDDENLLVKTTNTHDLIVTVNDDQNIDDETRERELTRLFSTAGITVEFVP